MMVWYMTVDVTIRAASGRFRMVGGDEWYTLRPGMFTIWPQEEGIIETEDLAILEQHAEILGIEP